VRKTSEKDVIFGSVSSTDIRDALVDQGFEVEKRKILLEEPIKRLGNYTVPIKIFHEERAEVKLEVIKEGEPSPKEEKEPGPDLSEEGAAASSIGREEAKPPVAETKEEDVQEFPVDAPAESEAGPVGEEAIQEEQKGVLEETKEVPPETDTQDSLVGGEGVLSEKETTEEPSMKEKESAPLDTDEEALEPKETEPEERLREYKTISEKEGTSPEEPEGGPEDTLDISEETNKNTERTAGGAQESEEQADEDKNKEEANKNRA
jgi:hypothetical protein